MPIKVSLTPTKGFSLLLGNENLFVPFAEFSWFKGANWQRLPLLDFG